MITIEQVENTSNIPPPDGDYEYDVAFAEWGGESIGEKVQIKIRNRRVEVRYVSGGNLPIAEENELLDSGILVRHKSGEWIIVRYQDEIHKEEIGGCTGGPSIIDFEKQKYWMC